MEKRRRSALQQVVRRRARARAPRWVKWQGVVAGSRGGGEREGAESPGGAGAARRGARGAARRARLRAGWGAPRSQQRFFFLFGAGEGFLCCCGEGEGEGQGWGQGEPPAARRGRLQAVHAPRALSGGECRARARGFCVCGRAPWPRNAPRPSLSSSAWAPCPHRCCARPRRAAHSAACSRWRSCARRPRRRAPSAARCPARRCGGRGRSRRRAPPPRSTAGSPAARRA